MMVIKLLFAALPRLIAGFRQRAIKGLPVRSVSLEDLVSDDRPPLPVPPPSLPYKIIFFLRFLFFFFTEDPDLKTSHDGLCLSMFKEHSDEENTHVFQRLGSTNTLFL